MSYIRDGETHPAYLGDGLYAACDGYQIWLRAERDGMMHEIAIEGPVWTALKRYVETLNEARTVGP